MKNLITYFLNFIFPFKCTKCKSYLNTNSILCHKCWNSIVFISDPCCYICSTPFQYSFNIPKTLLICALCRKKPPLFDKLISIFEYTDDIKSIIFDFKYNDKLYLAKHLGDLLNKRFESYFKKEDFDIIIPVPLHKLKLKKRMYNQSSLLAKHIAKSSNIKFIPDLLIRKKYEGSQTNYTKRMRAKNVLGAFAINKKYQDIIKNKKIILVDDVITTGATINECCKVLRKQQCESIIAITIAKRIL